MADISVKLDAAATFLLQSPPGEVNDVFNDIRVIVSEAASDDAFAAGILPALTEYNLKQFVVVQLQGESVLITEPARVTGDGNRFLDPRRGITFAFDQITATASDPQLIATDAATESIRSSIDTALRNYVTNQYHDGVAAVYALPDPNYPPPVKPEPPVEKPVVAAPPAEPVAEEAVAVEPVELVEGEAMMIDSINAEPTEPVEMESETPAPTIEAGTVIDEPVVVLAPAVESRIFSLIFVANKYNQGNYWTGRWRSIYTADLAKGTLVGETKIDIHYYEQGNVQLSTVLNLTTPIASNATAGAIVNLVKLSEESFQSQLAQTYSTFSEETFRALRRPLPKTRSRLDWTKIAGYRLGTELGGSISNPV